MRIVSISLAAALVTAVTFASAFAAERWETLPKAPAMPVSNVAGYAPVNGIHMYYAVYGAGDPVLLIHGGLGHADLWANQVRDLMNGPYRDRGGQPRPWPVEPECRGLQL